MRHLIRLQKRNPSQDKCVRCCFEMQESDRRRFVSLSSLIQTGIKYALLLSQVCGYPTGLSPSWFYDGTTFLEEYLLQWKGKQRGGQEARSDIEQEAFTSMKAAITSNPCSSTTHQQAIFKKVTKKKKKKKKKTVKNKQQPQEEGQPAGNNSFAILGDYNSC